MIIEDLQRQVLVDPLGDVEGRHDLQQQAGHDAEGAEVDRGAAEGLVPAGQLKQVTVRGDQGQAGHGRGQVLVRGARPVGGGRAGAGHRDVRQRGQITQREAQPVQPPGDLGVAQPRGHPGQGRGRVDRDFRRQSRQGDLGAGRIGHVVERMAGAQHADPARPRDHGLELAQRDRAMKVRGPEGDVARPVRSRSRVQPPSRSSGPVFPRSDGGPVTRAGGRRTRPR